MNNTEKHFFKGAEILTRAMMRLADARLQPRTCYSDYEDEANDLKLAKSHIRKSLKIIEIELTRISKNKRVMGVIKKYLARKPTDPELALLIFLVVATAIQDDLSFDVFSVSKLVRTLPLDKTSNDVSVLPYFRLFTKESDLRKHKLIYLTNVHKYSPNMANCRVVLAEHFFRELLTIGNDKEVYVLEFTAENDLVTIK